METNADPQHWLGQKKRWNYLRGEKNRVPHTGKQPLLQSQLIQATKQSAFKLLDQQH